MELKIYLVRNKLTVVDFSKKIKCSRAYLSEIVNGTKKPSRRLAEDIEQATNGETKIKDLLGG